MGKKSTHFINNAFSRENFRSKIAISRAKLNILNKKIAVYLGNKKEIFH